VSTFSFHIISKILPNFSLEKKQNYFLFLGRIYEGKGVQIAIEATQSCGQRLIIAGQNSLSQMGYKQTPDHVTEYGYATVEERKKLMSNAIGAYVPSLYNEPFGGVQVECLFSGTPTITTDWGSFTENNVNGLTGYRCRTFEDFQFATFDVTNGKIKPQDCRDFAMARFTLDVVSEKYEKYFQSVMDLYKTPEGSFHTEPRGWYTNHPDKWIEKISSFGGINPRTEVVLEDF